MYKVLAWIEYGLTSHATQFRSFRDKLITGLITTQSTVSKHWRRCWQYSRNVRKTQVIT